MATNLLFEGDDLEALLVRAHQEGGPQARIVRAEKVRQGGVMGFFAKECFEVAVEIPDDEGGPPSGPISRHAISSTAAPTALTADSPADLLVQRSEQALDDVPRGAPFAPQPIPALATPPAGRHSAGGLTEPEPMPLPLPTPTAAANGDQLARLLSGELSPDGLAAEGLLAMVDRVSAAERAAAHSVAGQPLSAPQDPAFHVALQHQGAAAPAEHSAIQLPRETDVEDAAQSAAYAALYAAVHGTDLANVAAGVSRSLVGAGLPGARAVGDPQSSQPTWQAARFPIMTTNLTTGPEISTAERHVHHRAAHSTTESPELEPTRRSALTRAQVTYGTSGAGHSVPTLGDMVTGYSDLGSENDVAADDSPLTVARPSTVRPEFTALLDQLRSGTRPATSPQEPLSPAIPAARAVPASESFSTVAPATVFGSVAPATVFSPGELVDVQRQRAAADAAADAAAADAVRRVTRRLEAERDDAQRREVARLEAEQRQAEQREADQREAARLEAARLEAAQLEAARLEAERAASERGAAAELEIQRRAEALEMHRRYAERTESTRRETARQESARELAADAEPLTIEAETAAAIQAERAGIEAAQLEARRLHAQQLHDEATAAVRAEAQRIAKEQIEAHQRETERIAAADAKIRRTEAFEAARRARIAQALEAADAVTAAEVVKAAEAARAAAEAAKAAELAQGPSPQRGIDGVDHGSVALPALPTRGNTVQVTADRATLRSLGVPASWTRRLRTGDRFAAVLKMLGALPAVEIGLDVPVVAVIGAARVVQLEAHRTAVDLPLGATPRPVVVIPATVGAARAEELARSQRHPAVVVAIETDGYQDIPLVLESLETVRADAVIAVVDARRPLEETQAWLDAFGSIDAIAVDGASLVGHPATVLQLGLPVIRLDGLSIDRVTWTALLCAQLEAATPADPRA